MPILDIQHGLPRVGKIRLGIEVEASNGKMRPSKLDTFRLTSPDKNVIERAAAIPEIGGTPRPWDNDGAPEFELVTNTNVLDVLITPEDDAFSQWYELWSGGGCQRRCDGFVEQLTGDACKCPSDPQERAEKAKALKPEACKQTTRVSVVLPQIPRIGSWMLESHGYYAAKELGSTFALLDMAGARRNLLPARLRIEQRVSKRPGQPINKYGVPVLDIGMRFDELVGLDGAALPAFDPATGEIGGSEQAALPSAEPKTSVKKAVEARKTTTQMSAEVKGNDPVDPVVFTELKARLEALEPPARGLCDAAGVTLRSRPKRSELAAITAIIVEAEVKQAEAWEGRRQRVFAALQPFGFDDDARHQFISDATSGATASTKTLTEEQAGLILVAAGGAEQQSLAAS